MDVKTEYGQFMSTVKVGSKGQIVIPKEIRDMFGIEPGQSLVIMADLKRGIALQRQEIMTMIADAIMDGRGREVMPNEDPAGYEIYAEAIKKAIKPGGDGK